MIDFAGLTLPADFTWGEQSGDYRSVFWRGHEIGAIGGVKLRIAEDVQEAVNIEAKWLLAKRRIAAGSSTGCSLSTLLPSPSPS